MKKITANDFYDELKRGTYFPYRVQAAIIEIEQKLSEKVQALRHNNEQESKKYDVPLGEYEDGPLAVYYTRDVDLVNAVKEEFDGRGFKVDYVNGRGITVSLPKKDL